METEIPPDTLRSRVTSWLLSEGWQLAERAHDDASWLIEAKDGGGRFLLIGQKKNRGDQILLEATVGIATRHQEQIRELPEPARRELLWELRFALLHLGIEFHGVSEPLERISIGQRIYGDGLSKDAFLQRVSLVRNGILAAIWTVARRLPGGAEPEEAGSLGIN